MKSLVFTKSPCNPGTVIPRSRGEIEPGITRNSGVDQDEDAVICCFVTRPLSKPSGSSPVYSDHDERKKRKEVHANVDSWIGMVWYGVVLWSGVVWCGKMWYGLVWFGMVWCGVVWYGIVWLGMVWCGEVRCGVVWRGVVWCGVAWCGVVWRGVVWRGVV